MVYKKLLEGIYNKIDPELEVRRYNLSDMISESYRVLYECKNGSNLQKIVESHLDDIRKNPSDIERLSRQLCTIKEVVRMTESGEIKDTDLILKSREKIDSRKPMRESTKPRKLKRANESEKLPGCIGAKVGDTIIDSKTGKEGVVKKEGQSGNYGLIYVDFGNGLRKINPMDDAQRFGRYQLKECDNSKKSVEESTKPRKLKRANESSCDPEDEELLEDSDLTDEEVEELTKHLEEIRKKKGNAPKKEDMIEDSKRPRRELKEDGSRSWRSRRSSSYRSNEMTTDDMRELASTLESLADDLETAGTYSIRLSPNTYGLYPPYIGTTEGFLSLSDTDKYLEDDDEDYDESVKPRKLKRANESTKSRRIKEDKDPDYRLQNQISEGISDVFYDIFKSHGLDPEDDALLQNFYYAVDIDSIVYDAAKFIEANSFKVSESKIFQEPRSYRGLDNFKKLSESKAFYKTFKKMHDSLKEGKTLTRQESISLYKAANSALTHLSVELEHNPEFLDTFRESTSLLSEDVNSLRESIAKGNAPSKRTMNSLAKFSEALLYEADDEEDIDDLEPPIEDSEEETPEDSNEFDQDYADARVELHKQLLDKHADNDDPEVQEKLAQDSEEVKSLPGITDEQIAELEGGESDQSEEDPEEDDLEDIPDEEDDLEDTDESVDGKDLELGDSDDITDDELAELKKHLKEMRKINKTLSENAKVGDRIVVNRDEDYYTDHGYKVNKEGYVVKKVENYGVFINGYNYLIPHSDYKILPKKDK